MGDWQFLFVFFVCDGAMSARGVVLVRTAARVARVRVLCRVCGAVGWREHLREVVYVYAVMHYACALVRSLCTR